MKNKKSIINVFRKFSYTVSCAILFVGFWLIIEKIYLFNQRTSEIIEEQTNEERVHLKMESDRVIDDIDYYTSKVESDLKEQLKEIVYMAHSIASNIYNEYKDIRTEEEIKLKVKNALRPIRFNEKRGYIFICSLDGIEELYPVYPEYEGKNFLSLQDDKGNYVIKKEIELVKEHHEGFVTDYWRKPNEGNKGMIYPKISFVKGFDPLNWYIGAGDYLDDVENKVKRELLKRIENFKLYGNSYIFADEWNGLGLIGPEKGKYNYNITDVNGVKVVQEFIKISKEGSGYLAYIMPNGDKTAKKISYVFGIPKWRCYVGIGTEIDFIDKIIEEKRNEIIIEIVINSSIVLTVLFSVLIFFFLSSKGQLKRLKNTLALFSAFFEEAGHKSAIIDENKIMFSDFAPIATLANKMIEERNKAENKLKSSLEENTILLKEVHHRVKNNLQVIMSLIRLQMSNIEDKKIKNYFIDMKNRVFSMALIHEKFYGSNVFSTINIKIFVNEFIKNIIQSYSIETNVSVNLDIKDLFLKIDIAIPIGLIINEIISNSMKYAFKERENGLIELKLYEDKDKSELNLLISDDGIGIPKNIDVKTTDTLGLNLIYSFVSQLDGNITLETDKGTTYHITIPIKK